MERFGYFKQSFLIVIALNFVIQVNSQTEDAVQITYPNIIELEDDTNKVKHLLVLSKEFLLTNLSTRL